MNLNNTESYPTICFEILERLSNNLPPHLTYHCLEHTLDVANSSDAYIKFYDIDEAYAELIRIAAIAHDIGYMDSPVEHEKRSTEILSTIIKDYDYSQDQIEKIKGMIMATKIPQNPQNFYEQIIADADLDYLGRNDYDVWSSKLYKEFLHYKVVNNETDWLNLQINFLKNHKYHTEWAIKNRVGAKCKKLDALERLRLEV